MDIYFPSNGIRPPIEFELALDGLFNAAETFDVPNTPFMRSHDVVGQADPRELFVRKTIVTYGIMDDEGVIYATLDSYAEAAADVEDGEQIIELTGTGFVRA